jgi:hypothetical protein
VGNLNCLADAVAGRENTTGMIVVTIAMMVVLYFMVMGGSLV